MSHLDPSLDAALLSNDSATSAVAAGSAGSLKGAACQGAAQPDSKAAAAKAAQGLATSNANHGGEALSFGSFSSGSKTKLSATNLKIYAALAPFDGVELSGAALFSLAEDKKWFSSHETKIFAYLQQVGRCSLEVLQRKTGVRASILLRALSFFEHLELIKLSANDVCLLQNQPVDFAQPVVNRNAVKEAKITIDLKAICDRSMKLFNNTVVEALRKFKAINVLDLRAFSGVSPARFLCCCGQLLATGKAVYRAGVLYWAPRGLLVKPRSTRKPVQENHQDDVEPDGTCNGAEGQGHGAAAKGSALSPKGATVASGTTANMSVSPAESHDIQREAAIDIDLDQVISLSDRMSPRSVSPASSSFVLSFDADAQAAMDPIKAPFSQEPQEVPALASSFEKNVTLSGSTFPPMVKTALHTAPDMWLEFATYSGCTLVEPVERGYSVWDVVQNEVVHNEASEPASNTQLSHEPVEANNEPQLSSKTVADGRGTSGHRDSTCPLEPNADEALVPELIEEDEEIEVAPTDTYACHVGDEAGAEVLAQELCSEQVEQASPVDQTILVPQVGAGHVPHPVEPSPTHKELSAPMPVKVPPSCAMPSPQVDTSAASVRPETEMPRIEQPCATAQIVPTSVAQPVVPHDLGAGAVNQREQVSGWPSPSPSVNAPTGLSVAQPNRGQMGGARPVVNASLPIPPQCMHPAWLAPSSFNDAEKRQEEKRRKAENYRRAEALVKRQFFAERARQEAQEAAKQGVVSQPLAQSQVQAQPRVQPQPRPQLQPRPQEQPQSYGQARPQPQVQPRPQDQSQSYGQPQVPPQPQVQPQSYGQARPQPQVQPRPQAQPQSYGQPRPQVRAQPQVQPRPQVLPQSQVPPQPQVQPRPQVQMLSQVQPQSQVSTDGVKSGRKLPIDYMRHYVEPELRPDMTKTLEYRVIKMWCYQGEFGSMTPSPELIRMAAQAYGETIGREVTPNDAPAIFELLEALHKRRVEQARQRKTEQY